jgi:hypothetical protein
MISSPLMDGEYDRLVPDYDDYRNRKIAGEERSGPGPSDSAGEDDTLKRSR